MAKKGKKVDSEQHPLYDRCAHELKKALKDFGTYTFDDKGAHEVMDLGPLLDGLRELPSDGAAKVLKAMYDSPDLKGRLSALSAQLVGGLEDWDELFDQPELAEIDW